MAAPPALSAARIAFDADGPLAPDFGDHYHARIGAQAQAQAVFLAGNALPARWQGRSSFCIAENGFGLGQNFLATWAAWRADPQRSQRLHYVGVDAHPPTREDLARALQASPHPALAQALAAAWPPLVAGWHLVDLADLDGGRLRLLLAWGDAQRVWRELRLQADAFYLDGFAPDRNPAMWTPELLQAIARRAAPGATAASWCVARRVRDGLSAAGFRVETGPPLGDKRETLRAVFAPRPTMHRAAPPAPPGEVLVLGAGIAGAWAAHELAALGCTVRVVDRRGAAPPPAPGRITGLFHGVVMADDGAHARALRAAALHAEHALQRWMAAGVPGRIDGLLRLADREPAAMQALLARHALPPSYAQALDAPQASALAGVTLPHPAWFYPGGGWIAPIALVGALLQGLPYAGGVDVARIARRDGRWTLFDAEGRAQAQADTLVLANAADAARLAPQAGWALGRSRGQVSLWTRPPAGAPRPRLPLAGSGYLIAPDDGSLLAGATAQPGDDDGAERERDHDFNRARLQQLCGWAAPPPDAGRVGWRAQTPDRLPLIGAVPAGAAAATTRMAGVAREPGLFVLAGLGSRGLTWGPLAGRLLAGLVSGAPLPLPAALADALDPGRWRLREARHGG